MILSMEIYRNFRSFEIEKSSSFQLKLKKQAFTKNYIYFSVNTLLEAVNRTGRLVDRILQHCPLFDIMSFDITAVWHRVDIISKFSLNRMFNLFCKIVA